MKGKAALGLCIYKETNPYELKNCLESIWSTQSRKPDEIIIISDGPIKEKVREMVQEFKKVCSLDIIYLNNDENIGLTKSLNQALKISNSEYFIRMDTDDIAMKDRFLKQINYLDQNQEISILGTNAYEIDGNNVKLRERMLPEKHEDIIKLLPWLNPITHPTVVFRRKDILQIGGYDERYRTSQDYDLWFRARSAGLKFHNLQESLLFYRINDGYHKRKDLRYRLKDIRIKYRALKNGRLSFLELPALIIPLIVWLVPSSLYNHINKIDPRKK